MKEMYSISFDPKEKEILGYGMTATVYGYRDKMAVKLYKPEYSRVIEREIKKSYVARNLGIPCAKVYMRVLSVDGRKGLVLDRLNGKTMQEVLFADRTNRRRNISLLAGFVREIHKHYENDDEIQLSSALKDFMDEIIYSYKKGWVDEEMAIFMRDFLETIPDENVFLHGDLGLSNIILCEDNIMLIDMCNACFGPSICDYASVYGSLFRKRRRKRKGELLYDNLLRKKIWHRFLQLSFPEKDRKTLKKIQKKIMLFHFIRYYLFYYYHNDGDRGKSITRKLNNYMKHFNKSEFINLGI